MPVITDTIAAPDPVKNTPNIRILPTAPVFAQAILNIWNGTSVSSLFEIPTLELVANEIKIGGSLVGDYIELVELMELNADGKVKMHQTEYKLANINDAIDDFKNRRFTGRGVIVP